MEFNIPLGVSAIRGVARPLRGLIMIDFVTTAPISESGKNCESSLPDPAQPLAVKIGFGSLAPARSAANENVMLRMSPRGSFACYPTQLENHP